MNSLPTRNDSANLRRTKKKINTWFLDNRSCLPGGKGAFILTLIGIIFALYFFLSSVRLNDKLGNDLENINSGTVALHSNTRKEVEERQKLEQRVKELESELKTKERIANQKEQQILVKNSNIEDLKMGLSLFEQRVQQLEQQLKQQAAQLSSTPTPIPPPSPSPQPVVQQKQISEPIVQENEEEPIISQTQEEQEVQPPQEEKNLLNSNGGNEDTEKKNAVRNAFLHAWNSYKEYAWGTDELKPVSKSNFNWLGLGVTIVDALDTIWIMGLHDEFKLARDWVESSLSFDRDRDVSFFETTIRELGGLLGAYEFSRDRMFLDKAEDLANRLMSAFDTSLGIPNGSVNLRTKISKSLSWTSGASILSEIGSVQLEFFYLAYHTNKPKYAIKALDVFKHLDSLEKDRGLYNLYIDLRSGNMRGKEISLGALGDSFYEYMLKLWLLTDQQFNGYSRMYKESSVGIKEVLVRTSKSGYRYVDQIGRSGYYENRMEHLTCFAGGMFALGALHNVNPDTVDEDIQLGADITESCHEAYTRTKTKIGPEFFEFTEKNEFIVPDRAKHYLLRPETVESYFVLWRTTHDQKYRDWAWEAFQAIEKHCRLDSGYSGLQNVDNIPSGHDDLQQSFFLAETLKYLYLIFSDDDVIPLDKYVFNTEAHPLGIITEDIDAYPQELRFHMIEF